MKKIIIALDCMGGDNAPKEIIKGAIWSLKNNEIKVLLFGDKEKIENELKSYKYDKNRIEIIPTTEVIENEESPTLAIKSKKNSSMIVGLNYLKDNKADGFISAGSTGALLTGATMIVGRIKGVKRPVLATLLPNPKGHCLLLDAGANVDCKSEYLRQFAIIGSLYVEKAIGIKNAKVGLVNIGTEEGKGNELTKETFYLLKESNINFVGNVEARDIPMGEVDVAVCDGFVGNIILKISEGTSKVITMSLKDEIIKSILSKIGALLSKSSFERLKKRFDYREIGGAPFLGLKSLVVKAHGSSDALAISSAINQCYTFAKSNVVEDIEKEFSSKKGN